MQAVFEDVAAVEARERASSWSQSLAGALWLRLAEGPQADSLLPAGHPECVPGVLMLGAVALLQH
jgi:hypothetical protein